MNKLRLIAAVAAIVSAVSLRAWPGMDMPVLHVEGRYLVDENGNHVNLHGFGQTYSPWFNEQNSKWGNYDVNACLTYNKKKIDELLDAGWKVNYLRLHMDPYWSNTPGVKTEGEHDISAFDFNRFRTYLNQVFIPMAEYAISKGLYVVMRPPGVCPEQIEIGDDYHKYLKKVWGYVSAQAKLKNNPHIMYELANEPVRIKGTDGQYGSSGDACFQNLTAYFQEIVDLMRKNCSNILWVPGTGYQSQYAGYAKYPIVGENIGYAVHVYPGWYGSDAMEPSHELGGTYGGGFEKFSAGWDAQIRPAADIAPIMVTEMDWAPSVYNASWGKSITGKMMGDGFGANFKLLADNTGNVSWMLFTGPEWLAKFRDTPGSEGNYSFINDPDACPWPIYHWFKAYAGDELPPISSISLNFSPRKLDDTSELLMSPGGKIFVTLIGDNGQGYEMNLDCGMLDVTIDDPSVIGWENGYFTAYKSGKSKVTISYDLPAGSVSKEYVITASQFPLIEGSFNPSIWEKGTFDPSTGDVKTGQWGFAGWYFPQGIDLSESTELVAEISSENNCGLSFRVYDQNNYWSDPAIVDFGTSRSVKLDLNNLKSNNGRVMDSSHIYYVGFWSTGGASFRPSAVYATGGSSALPGCPVIADGDADNDLVDVYSLQGCRVKTQVSRFKATDGLLPGIYIVGDRKVAVTH